MSGPRHVNPPWSRIIYLENGVKLYQDLASRLSVLHFVSFYLQRDHPLWAYVDMCRRAIGYENGYFASPHTRHRPAHSPAQSQDTHPRQ